MISPTGGSSLSNGLPGFSFRQTEPTKGQYSGSSWDVSGAGLQYSHLDSSTQAQDGFSDTFNSFALPQVNGHDHSQTGRMFPEASGNQWSIDYSATPIESTEMSRLPSRESTRAQARRTTQTSAADFPDQGQTMRLYSSASQGSYSIASTSPMVTTSSASTASSICTPAQHIDIPGFDDFAYSSAEDLSGTQTLLSNTVHGPGNALTPFNLLSSTADNIPSTITMDTKSIISSPSVWDPNMYLDSERSSPTLDDWALPPQMLTPNTNSPLSYSSVMDADSPRYSLQDHADLGALSSYASTRDRTARKPLGPRQSKVASDLANSRQRLSGLETSDDTYKLVGRSALEIDNTARDHPLYQNVRPQGDGLYHCPWEGQSSCQHKPEKLKCNYEYEMISIRPLCVLPKANLFLSCSKFVDSHLKPYRCKVPACESLHFSSTACLLRHEREAHAMHGHGDKPFLCTYEHCERAVAGNGFPRHWNLRDHMKRVHNDPGTSRSNASNTPPPPSGRGKKRKTEATDSPPLEKQENKRVATPVLSSQGKKEEGSLFEHYRTNKQRLAEMVEQMDDPKKEDNFGMLRAASDCIKAMAQINQRINGAYSMRRTPSPTQVEV